MRIALFTPKVHFHVPVVLRSLARRLPEAEFRLYATPKLSGIHGKGRGTLGRVARLVRRSGFRYLAAMTSTQAALMFFERMAPLGGSSPDRFVWDCRRFAEKLGFETRTINDVRSREVKSDLSEFGPDWIVTVFFNQIMPDSLLRSARRGAVNLHPSFLPSYRGVSPCFWVLAEGNDVAGVTVHELTARLDKGRILARKAVPVLKNDTVFGLYRRCAAAGGPLLAEVLQGKKGPVEEKAVRASYRSEITPEAVTSLRRRGHRFFLVL